MGRSVSYPRGALVAYARTPHDEAYCLTCDSPVSECHCPAEEREHSEECQWDWEWISEDLQSRAKALFPALWEVDEWRGREDYVLARNRLVDFGVSEYCGLMAIWVVPRENLEASLVPFAERRIASIEEKFLKEFGEYVRLGGLSDGTSVYKRVVA